MEKIIINLIKSLDRIMDTWEYLTLRRTLVSVWSMLIITQLIITTIYWMLGREISNTWLGILGLEAGVIGAMISWYFSERKKNNGNNNQERRK